MSTLRHHFSTLTLRTKTTDHATLSPPPADSRITLDSSIPTNSKRKTLKRYTSYLSVRIPTRKGSALSLRTSSDSSLEQPSLTLTSSATSSTSSSSAAASPPTTSSNGTPPTPAFAPPASTSEYRWNHLSSPHGRKVWWRNVDSMANFILHWQTRFHQHGDMFGSCTLGLSSPSPSSTSERLYLTRAQLRESIRRLRYNHPTVALRLAKRSELGIDLLPIPPFLESKVNLQVALVYDIVESEEEVEAWLDDVLTVHSEERIASEEEEFSAILQAATTEGVPGRNRLRIHFWPATNDVDARVLVEQSHSVSEGIGTMLVFDLLLQSISSVLSHPQPTPFAWGSEVVRLEPALQDAIASPPPTWEVGKAELKAVQKVNGDRMNGKATPPNTLDKLGTKIVGVTLNGHSSPHPFRSQFLNKPLVSLCRGVAEKGDMLPLGLLPQTGIPFTGKRSHTAFLSDSLNPQQTKALLSLLKNQGLTLAPFLEACAHMATMWTRKHRGLVSNPNKDKNKGFDNPNRILGSFSNAISKRDTLKPEYSRYLGLCMSGFPTKIACGSVTWSTSSEDSTTPSKTDPRDPVPNVAAEDVETLLAVTRTLADQYKQGRENPDWLRYDKALMFGTMQTEYLFLRDEAHYPSMPWLSSVGRLENVFSGTYPLTTPHDGEKKTQTFAKLEAHNMRLLGRVGIRQPILHVYTFRMQTTIQLSFAEWLYAPANSEGRKLHSNSKAKKDLREEEEERQNILQFWLQVYRSLIDAVLTNTT
ncbi:uncharacterized protein UTRI_06123 [Ustilago trichophora]|uniref:Acyltransferase invovled in MEL production n=1 Tax=Ustilago trichophora TaxID=86804 RepID=A0A5C3EET3_9BASI|nr:uncharacterized protein UTRI_06123 [Ustilago trichophora]